MRLAKLNIRRKISGMSDTLYEQDFFRWTERQAQGLREAGRSGINLPLDWENLADEIESLGRRDRRELGSRVATIIEHLLKLEYSPAARSRSDWLQTVRRERNEIERLLKDSPSLRQQVPRLVEGESRCAAEFAAEGLQAEGEIAAKLRTQLSTSTYTEVQILGDWFPSPR